MVHIYAEIRKQIDSRKLYETIGMNVTDFGPITLVYGECSDAMAPSIVGTLLVSGASTIQIGGDKSGKETHK